MKIKFPAPVAAVAVVTFIVVSCRKEAPGVPVNSGAEPACSLCIGEMLTLDSSNLILPTNYAQQTTFLKDGALMGPNQISDKTPTGFYGYQGGVSIEFTDAALSMACTANKVTFVHGRLGMSDPGLVNVKFPATPLISSYPEELGELLAPYGYTAENYSDPGPVWMGTEPGAVSPGILDSIIIRGPEFGSVIIGADLFESELRNICISYE